MDLIAQHGLGDIDIQVEKDIIALTAEVSVVLHLYFKVKIPMGSAVDAGLAFTRQTDLDTVGNPGRDGDQLADRLLLETAAVTGWAGGFDNLATSITAWAGDNLDHRTQQGLMHLAHFSLASAL